MKFIVNTQPLKDALNLGIINANVSNFHKKSCIIQISADANTLRINIEASMICTELTLKGSGEGQPATIFVDSLLFKQLINTLETSTVTLEYTENGLVVHSGKSKFNVPKMIDSTELELASPVLPSYDAVYSDIKQSDWKYIKEHQMYAISLAFIHPVYTRVWIGEGGDVIVGDFDASLFTHSVKNNLGNTCLLSDTIINLFISLPDGAKLTQVGRDYVIQVVHDSFTYRTQFTPGYEDDEEIGSYNSEIFLSMMQHPDSYAVVPVAAVTKLLNQAQLLSNTSEDTITFSIESGILYLKDRNVEGQIIIQGDVNSEYSIEFKLDILKKVISNYEDETICVSPLIQNDEVAGILIWNDELTTIVAGVE